MSNGLRLRSVVIIIEGCYKMTEQPDSETYSDAAVIALDFSNWPQPDEYALEVGRIMGLWANLEDQLGQFIGKLAGFDEFADRTALILTAHLSFPQKLQMFETLCELLQDQYQHLQAYKNTSSKIRSAQTERNKYAHNGMFFDVNSKNVKMTSVSARGKLRLEVNVVTVLQLRRVLMKINEATISLYNLVLNVNHPCYWNRDSGEPLTPQR